MPELTGSQRKYLRGLANQLKPIVYIGKQGVTGAVVSAADEALDAHELIKMKFNEFKDDKQPRIDEVAQRTGAEVCGVVGHVAILYRQHREPDQREIELPE